MHSTEAIVRQFFELCGFATISGRKVQVPRGWSDIDLVVINAAPEAGQPSLALDLPGLRRVERAIVSIKGTGTKEWSKLTVSNLRGNAPRGGYFPQEAVQSAQQLFAGRPFKTVLVWPEVPEEVDEELAQALLGCGIDHLLGFQMILETLVTGVDVRPDYGDSEAMQMIRFLKLSGWLRDRPLPAAKEMSLKERQRIARSAFGMWKDRDDVGDAVEFVDRLRGRPPEGQDARDDGQLAP